MEAPQNGGMSSFAFSAGVAVRYLEALKKRIEDIHERVVDNTLREAGRADHPFLGIADREILVAPECEAAIVEASTQSLQIELQITLKQYDVGLIGLAANGLEPGELEVVLRTDLVKKKARSFHGSFLRALV